MLRRILVAALVGIFAAGAGAAGCARPGPVGPAGSPSSSPSGATSPELGQGRLAAIYVAVLRRYLTTSDHSFGDDHRFPMAYIFDRADPRAASTAGGTGELMAIPAQDQAAIVAGLADIGPVQFVSDRAGVVEETGSCQQVRGGGVLIRLAPPSGTSGRVEVGIHGFVACLAATWFTYVVEGHETAWTVTGITGPIAVA